MRHAQGWDSFVRRHWEKSPAHFPMGLPDLPPAHVFRNVAEASAPFRFGTRFRALPDVRFFVGDAVLRSPGRLLPGDRDRDVAGYLRRVTAQVGKEPFLLIAEQPFMLDFPLWDGVRHFLRGLLERVGLPVRPIISDVIVGDFARAPESATSRLGHAVLTLVLQGRLRIRVGEGNSRVRALEAQAGEVLYTPSHVRQIEEGRGGCLAVRLWIPVTHSAPSAVVKEVLVALLEQRLPEGHAVPYLEYPWRRRREGAGASVKPLVRIARELEQLTHGPDLLQALRIIWAQRVSACGLEPVPPPREVPPLEDGHLVRASARSPIVRMQDSPGQWIWAVNGHAFPMEQTPESLRLLEALSSGVPLRAGELCQGPRRAAQRRELRRVLETLHVLRAVERVSEERS